MNDLLNDRTGQVQQMLANLAKHGDLVSLGLEGLIELGDKVRNRAIDDLVSINALKPYEEGVYRLNPRLRDYISDHLQSYTAYQTLTRIHAQIHRARTLWNEVRSMRETGDLVDVDRLEWALDDTVTEIAYAIERNLLLLNSQVSTEYGNVTGLRMKMSQNNFYRNEINASLTEMDQVKRLVEDISEETLAHGNFRIRQLINRRLGARMLLWRSHLTDAQAIIDKRLFWAERMEKQVHNLSRGALWLGQNRTRQGFEFPVEVFPDPLLRPIAIRVLPQLDAGDTDPLVVDDLAAAVARLPARKLAGDASEQAPKLQMVISDVESTFAAMQRPEEVMLEALLAELQAPAATLRTVSLLEWKVSRHELDEYSPEEWLLYASGQLSASGFSVVMQQVPPTEAIPINRRFNDFLVDHAPLARRI